MSTTIVAPIVLTILGIVFGAILAFASKIFAVEKDPREEAISEILPGANCGGFANAVVKGLAPVDACAPGGPGTAAKIGEIMGIEVEAGVRVSRYWDPQQHRWGTRAEFITGLGL